MLVRLTPQQANDFWSVIKWNIAKALPYGESDKRFGSLLTAINNGSLHVLVYTSKIEAETTIKAVITTTLNIDHITNEKNFIVYTITSSGVSDNQAEEIHTGLMNFARSLECTRIVGYTTNDTMKSIIRRLGYKETASVFTMEVV